MMLELGSTIADLEGSLADGATLALADLRGGPAVVFFYPKDNTPGCTREAQEFRDLYPQFRQHGCHIVGVSRDSVASHGRFIAKHALPFALVADTDERWCNAFGVIGEKILYGRRYMGLIRSTFLLDADGVLIAEWRGVKVPGHAAAVLERLSQA